MCRAACLLVLAVFANAVCANVLGPLVEDTLAVDGQWWFDRLRGIAHHFAETIGPMNVDGKRFVALPSGDFFLVLLYSPWWYHCRRQLVEFDRLAQGLQRVGLADRLRAVTLDCSSAGNREACGAWLGPSASLPRVEYVGDNAPQYDRLVYNSLLDPWPAESMSLLLFGARGDFLDLGKDRLAEQRIASVAVPRTTSAEWLLQWVRHECVQSFGEVSLEAVTLESELAFQERSFQLRRHRPAQYATDQGCICREEWRRCSKSFWAMMGTAPEECTVEYHCPERLGYCETVWPCGEHRSRTDKCDPRREVADRLSEKPHDMHSHEEDIQAALALWLHDIFERHAFETLEEDPAQRRRGALVDFLQMLCSYFPDHLEGRLHQRPANAEGWDAEHASHCRSSLCRLGGLFSEQVLWEQYVEVVDADLQWRPLSDQTPPPGVKPGELRRGRVQRIRWQHLERDWKLCGRPWTDFAMQGFGTCQATDPLASGLPCGAWQLLHAVTAEAVLERRCRWRRTMDVDRCVGPRHNKTEADVLRLQKVRSQERIAEKIQRHSLVGNATVPRHMVLASLGNGSSRCFKAPGRELPLLDALAVNATLSLVLSERSPAPVGGRLTIRGQVRAWPSYMHFGNESKDVELDLVPDFIRDDGGAVVMRIDSDTEALRTMAHHSWKLMTVDGVAVKRGDWYTMLEHAFPGDTVLNFSGPVPCNTSDAKAMCDDPCASWSLISSVGTRTAPRQHLSVGKLRENTTGQCLGPLVAHPYGLPWLSQPLGLGLLDCAAAPSFRVEGRRALHNLTFCLDDVTPQECVVLHDPPKLPKAQWVEVDIRPTVHADVLDARTIVQRLRRMVGLFWRCEACRRNFLSIEFEGRVRLDEPQDALLWLWRAHNTISLELQRFSGYAPDYPPDPARSKELWPTLSLCPTCWNHTHTKDYALWKILHPHEHYQEGLWNETAVVEFLVGRFYASSAAYDAPANGSAAVRKRIQLSAAPPDAALPPGLGSAPLHDRAVAARYLHALGSAALVAAAVGLLLLSGDGRVAPSGAVSVPATPPVPGAPPRSAAAGRSGRRAEQRGLLPVDPPRVALKEAWARGAYTRLPTDDAQDLEAVDCGAGGGPCSCTPLL